MTHATHRMDGNSLVAYAKCNPANLHARIVTILSDGICFTARELSARLNAPLVSVRSRLSDGCAVDDTGLTSDGKPPTFRKAVRVEEEGSATKVWAYGLAQVPAAVGEA